MENDIIIKFLNENDVRFIISKDKKVYTLKLHREPTDQWVATVGNIKSGDTEVLIQTLLEKVFQDQQAIPLLNKLHIPKDLPVVI